VHRQYTIYFYDLDELGERVGAMKSMEITAESLDFALDFFMEDSRSFHTEVVGTGSGGPAEHTP